VESLVDDCPVRGAAAFVFNTLKIQQQLGNWNGRVSASNPHNKEAVNFQCFASSIETLLLSRPRLRDSDVSRSSPDLAYHWVSSKGGRKVTFFVFALKTKINRKRRDAKAQRRAEEICFRTCQRG
jgi:hypothetical protein